MNPIIQKLMPSRAWCLDRYGRVYDTYVHPFGSFDADSGDEDSAWLWCNGFKVQAPYCEDYLIKRFWIDFGPYKEEPLAVFLETISDSVQDIECVKHNDKSASLIRVLQSRAISNYQEHGSDSSWIDLMQLTYEGANLTKFLNNNVLRVRLGSEYQTYIENEGAIYFRISSTSFDWSDVIYHFLKDLQRRFTIKTVTVERDFGSTGDRLVSIKDLDINDFFNNRQEVCSVISDCGYCASNDSIDRVYPVIYRP